MLKLDALRSYGDHYGTAFVPPKYISDDGLALGTWVADQRYKYRGRRLPPEKAALLEAVPGWSWAGPRTEAVTNE